MRGYYVIVDNSREDDDRVVGIAATEEDLMDWSRDYYADETDSDYDSSEAYMDDPNVFVWENINGDVCYPGKDAFVIYDDTIDEPIVGVSPSESGIRKLLVDSYEEVYDDEDIDAIVDDIITGNNSDIWVEVAPVYDSSNKFNSSRRGFKKNK